MSRGAAARDGRPGQEAGRDNPAIARTGRSGRRSGAEAEFRSVYDAAGVAMARLTQRGRIIDVNKSFGKLLGRPAGELAGHRFLDLLHPDDRAALRAGRISTLKAGMVLAEVRLRAGDGVVWGRATISLARRADDAPDSLILTVEDISALKTREGALERERLHDRATGLANGDLLAFRLNRSIAASRRVRGKLAVLVLEIDRFEEIDEEQGPGSAEKLLAYLADRLQQFVRPADSVARTGGNELAVVLATISEAELATGVGRRLLARLEPEFHLGEAGFQVKISMGVALFPNDGGTSEALLRQARIDMYIGHRALPADSTGQGSSAAGITRGLGSGSPAAVPHPITAADGMAVTTGAGAFVPPGTAGAAPVSAGTGAAAAVSPPSSTPAAPVPAGTVESAPVAAEADPADAGEDFARRVEQ
nr:diguanylate cyclase [Candidatus Dormibacteraeota bacterium]